MSKFRVEFKPSKLSLALQLLTYGAMVLSVLNWQPEIIRYQFFLELLIIFIITIFIFRSVFHTRRQVFPPVVFSEEGEWLETTIDGQTGWLITSKSRVSSYILFIHLVSPINASLSRWRLLFKDQVNERDFRRLCRAVIYQQQNPEKCHK